jgi:hypothetical protein
MAKLKTVNIKGKPYVMVQEKIKHFRTAEEYKNWTLRSEIKTLNEEVVVVHAWVEDTDGVVRADAHAQEFRNASMINKTSYIENCETSAWGRVLSNLGIGVDTSVASAEEVLNAMSQQQQQKPSSVKFNPQQAVTRKQ